MTTFSKLSLLLSLSFLSVTANAADGNFSLGALSVHSTSIYKDTDQTGQGLPFVSYTSDHFYVKGTEAGYNLNPEKAPSNIGIGLAYMFAPFDPSDSNNADIRQLDSRDDTLMAVLHGHVGPVFAKLGQDVSGVHEGYYAEAGIAHPFTLKYIRIIPSIAYRYMDSKMSNYEFGVSTSDSNRTGGAIASYDSPAVKVMRFTINGIIPLTKSLHVNLGASYLKYDSSILDSPIIEKDHRVITSAGISYTF